MLKPFSAEEFRQDGLLPFHYQFAELYSRADSPKFWSYIAPTGTGRLRMTEHIIARELSAPDSVRVLVLAPASALLVQWKERISSRCPDVDVLLVDRKKFLELSEETAQGQDLWPKRSVILMSVDFAKRQDVRSPLVSTVWNLVVLDESRFLTGHRLDLFRALVNGNCMNRALLLTGIPGSKFDGVAKYEVAMGSVTDWNGEPAFASVSTHVYSIEYERTEDETRFLQKVVEACNGLVESFVSGRQQQEIMLRAASSATYAVENALRRLLEGLRPLRNKLVHGMTPSATDLKWVQSRLEMELDEITIELDPSESPIRDKTSFMSTYEAVENLLDSIDDISVDSKVEALVRHIQDHPDLPKAHMCILTSFRSTAEYLTTSLSALQVPVYSIGGTLISARSEVLQEFERTGGILVATDIALEGSNLHFVDKCINYDLPMNRLQMMQRWGRFLQYGRRTVFQMAVLEDSRKSLELEQQLLARSFGRKIQRD